ncbi:Hypothetical protein GbCGDNIH1_1587 [Granulibacter bethesdensis CGDNIH1]|uniref:Uncharacterized protein n=1 Tax=Granulibacter bethesdensis (strain ATCC BAA-1260 / CGDNIH1) TaxID=391165 RepID=Q0BRR7_GRABC|nr:Hypothetical protein GbCGDNIH1_1587 [Granulibacter bethesdensis CGDNIH1]APH52326.1 Hypothetical protein GbCGDNIH5_1587 [Granulibacter bethesdensis]APH65020.1 Hypothetical protein GbCGDNIH1I4_1587 [Granulibacter bethesdensis]
MADICFAVAWPLERVSMGGGKEAERGIMMKMVKQVPARMEQSGNVMNWSQQVKISLFEAEIKVCVGFVQ